MKKTLFLFCLLALSACSFNHVEPWERGNLAKAVMSNSSSAQHTALEQHAYVSKEATQGGYSIGAGGCGCN